MEGALYSILGGSITGGGIVFLFVMFQGQKIKETLRQEFYKSVDKVEHECKKYTDSKNDDIKEVLKEIKGMINNIQEILMNKN